MTEVAGRGILISGKAFSSVLPMSVPVFEGSVSFRLRFLLAPALASTCIAVWETDSLTCGVMMTDCKAIISREQSMARVSWERCIALSKL